MSNTPLTCDWVFSRVINFSCLHVYVSTRQCMLVSSSHSQPGELFVVSFPALHLNFFFSMCIKIEVLINQSVCWRGLGVHQVVTGNSLTNITGSVYENLTQPSWVASLNSLSNYAPAGMYLRVPVQCSCGNPDVSSEYGLFVTYPVVAGTGGNISGIATDFNTTTDVLKKFNKNVVWENSQPTQYAFIPVTGIHSNYNFISCISNSPPNNTNFLRWIPKSGVT